MRYKGKDIVVFVGESAADLEAIAAGVECSIDMDAETVEIASPTTGQWKEYKPKRKGWQVAASVLLDSANIDTVKGLIGDEIYLSFEYNQTPSGGILASNRVHNASAPICYHGWAICTKVQITAKNRDFAQASMSFLGNGQLN